MEFFDWETTESDSSRIEIHSTMAKSVQLKREELKETETAMTPSEQQQPADMLGVTSASVICVPAAIVAEEIEPTAKEFSKVAQPFEKELTQQQPHYPTENGIRRNFIADLFDLRGKKKKINANNNSVSLSDVLSMVKSKSKSKSKKSKKSKSSVKVACCC